MSSNNDNSGAAFGIAVVVAVLYFIGFAAYAVACFIALGFTVLSIIAWNRPLRLGSVTIYPNEARQLVLCGIIGAIGLPLFAVFSGFLLEFRIPDKAWFYLLTGGYALGALGLGSMLHENGVQLVEPLDKEPLALAPPPSLPQLPPPPSPPFQYASWDDEGEAESGDNTRCGGCAMRDAFPRDPSRPVFRL